MFVLFVSLTEACGEREREMRRFGCESGSRLAVFQNANMNLTVSWRSSLLGWRPFVGSFSLH